MTGSVMHQMAPYLFLGTQLGVTVLALGALGWWLDSVVMSAPWLMMGGLIVGCILGLIQFFRAITRLAERQKDVANTLKQPK